VKSKLQQITGGSAYFLGALSVIYTQLDYILSVHTLSWIILMASLILLYYFFRKQPLESKYHTYQNGLVWVNAILFLIFTTQITNIATAGLTSDLQHLLLSSIWIVYAVSVIVVGALAKKKKARLAGILFLFVTLLKIIFIDLPDVSAIIRAVLFLGLGGIGVTVSRLFYRKQP
jgi:uncharacterized membrane protein